MEAIMGQIQQARSSEIGQRHVNARAAGSQSPCTRCGGLMVTEVCIDLWSSVGEPACNARRCVQCGDVIDSIIVRNRQLAQACLTEACQSRELFQQRWWQPSSDAASIIRAE